MKLTSKTQLVNILRVQLSSRPQQAIKGLMRVYANQTSSEQDNEDVHFNNGIGFVHSDAGFLTSLAKQYESKGKLSDKQVNALYKIMPKYAGQLIEQSLAEGKIYKEGSEYKFRRS